MLLDLRLASRTSWAQLFWFPDRERRRTHEGPRHAVGMKSASSQEGAPDAQASATPFRPAEPDPLWQRAIPVAKELPGCRTPTAPRDLLAGVTVAALAIPRRSRTSTPPAYKRSKTWPARSARTASRCTSPVPST